MRGLLAFPDVMTDPTVDPDGRLARLFRELDFTAPYVKKQRRERNTWHLRVKTDGHDGKLALFVKVYRRPPLRNALTIFLPSRVKREWRNSRNAAACGLPVPAAIAAGERRVGGVVVDQFVAFRRIPRTRSVSRLLRRAVKRGMPMRRIRWRERFARALANLHAHGYRHGACSPRNALVRKKDPTKTVWWIDHPRGRLFSGSIHATTRALPDLVQALDSSLLAPDVASATHFLQAYAPGLKDFHRRVLARVPRLR